MGSTRIRRTSSFCFSDLPSSISSFNSFSDPSHHTPIPRPSNTEHIMPPQEEQQQQQQRSRNSSTSTTAPQTDFAIPQVDGASETRKKAKHRKNKAKQKEKKKKARENEAEAAAGSPGETGASVVVSSDSSETVRAVDTPDTADTSTRVVVTGPFIVHGETGRDREGLAAMNGNGPVGGGGESSTSTVREMSVHEGEGEEKVEDQNNGDDGAQERLACVFHGSALCQFEPGCCVHQSHKDCTCPPRWSCCCMHHSGDCCHCVYYIWNRESGEEDGKEESNDVSEKKEGENEVEENPNGHDEEQEGEKGTLNNNQETCDASPDSPKTQVSAADPTKQDPEPLAAHLLDHLKNSKFYDSQIVLRSGKDYFWPAAFSTHKVVISRSPLIATLFKLPEYQDGGIVITAIAGDNFGMAPAFQTALQRLYGQPLLTTEQLKSTTLEIMGYSEETQDMIHFSLGAAMADVALCYAASGAFLQLPEIVETGIKMTAALVSWDTIEIITYFGFHLTGFAITLAPVAGPVAPPDPSNEQTVVDQGQQLSIPDSKQELQDVWAPHLITAALTFIAEKIDATNFTLFTQAQSTIMPDRIPGFVRSVPGSILSNPRLTEVKFGSLSSIQEEKPSHEVVVSSAILINLPFKQLQEAFNIMGTRNVLTINLAQAVVAEREVRRKHALRVLAHKNGQKEQTFPDEVQELGYQEIITSKRALIGARDLEIDCTEIILDRKWFGLAVPEVTATLN